MSAAQLIGCDMMLQGIFGGSVEETSGERLPRKRCGIESTQWLSIPIRSSGRSSFSHPEVSVVTVCTAASTLLTDQSPVDSCDRTTHRSPPQNPSTTT